jgi:hypothetical protein
MVSQGHQRRTAVLRHIARYGLTLRPILERLFYAGHGKALDRDLDRLREQNFVKSIENAIPEEGAPQTRYSYYQLTTAGCRQVAAAESRARKVGGEALARNLAFLWFCCHGATRRHRLNESDLVDLFGEDAVFEPGGTDGKRELRLRGFHCLDRQSGKWRLLNLYAPRTSAVDVVVELRKRIRDLREIPIVAEAIDTKRYAFAVLAETTQLRDDLREELAKSLAREGIVFLVTKSPGAWRLASESSDA